MRVAWTDWIAIGFGLWWAWVAWKLWMWEGKR